MSKAQTKTPPRKTRGLRYWLKLLLAGLILALALLFGKLYLVLTAKPTVKIDYVQEYSKFLRRLHSVSDPNSNAAEDYERAFESLSEIPNDFRNSLARKRTSDLDEEDKNSLRKVIGLNKQCLIHLEKATAKPYCWYEFTSPPDSNGMSDIHKQLKMTEFFESARVVRFKIRLLLAEGNFEEALEQVAVFYGIAGHHGQMAEDSGPMLRMPAVRTGFTVLSEGQFESSSLAAFQMALEERISRNQEELNFHINRLLAYDVIQRSFTDNGRGNGSLIPKEAVKLTSPPIVIMLTDDPDEYIRDTLRGYLSYLRREALFGPDRAQTRKVVDEYFEYIDGVRNLTLWQLHDRGIEPEAHLDKIPQNPFQKHLLPGVQHILRQHQLCKTGESAFITTIAILRYEKDKGRLPVELEELVTACYLKQLPIDTCSDKPLIYRKTDTDFVLYSIGTNFTDDGGKTGTSDTWWRESDDGDIIYWPVPIPQSEPEDEESEFIEEENVNYQFTR